MIDWLVKACGEKEHKGVDVTRTYLLSEDQVAATDGERIHILPVSKPHPLPPAPDKIKEVYRECSRFDARGEVPLGLWGKSACGKFMTCLFEGISLDWQFFEDATELPGMKCYVGRPGIPVKFHHEASGAEAYVMPYTREQP